MKRLFNATLAAFSIAGTAVAQSPAKIPASATDANPRVAAILDSAPMTAASPVASPTVATAAACDSSGCPQWFVSGEYLYWVAQGQALPPLVSASPLGTPRNQAGVLGTPGATTLLGGTRVNDDWRSGLRVRAGYWFDDRQRCGLEADYFYLQDSRAGGRFGSPTGANIVSRPFTNALDGSQASQLVSLPGVLAGTVTVDTGSQFQGAGVVLRKNCECDPCHWLDMLVGYRYLTLTDMVNITENLTNIGQQAGVPLGTTILVRDRFRTENEFHGAVIGVATLRRYGHYYLEGRASVALGNTHQVVSINGSTTITAPGGVALTSPGGLLAQGTNIGTYSRNQFTVVPEFTMKAGVQATENLRVFVGYNWLLWSNVVRAGDQIDRTVNPTQIPPAGVLIGPARPAFSFHGTTMWVQGVSFGAELRF